MTWLGSSNRQQQRSFDEVSEAECIRDLKMVLLNYWSRLVQTPRAHRQPPRRRDATPSNKLVAWSLVTTVTDYIDNKSSSNHDGRNG